MSGQVYTVLYNETLRGGVSSLNVRVTKGNQDKRLLWVSTSIVRPGDYLEKNAMLILENYIDPLAAILQVDLPRFRVSFEKTPLFMYHSRDQLVCDASAGVALLIALVSAMLELPTSESVVVTGGVEPPHKKIADVRGLKEKIKAALDAGISNILIPARHLGTNNKTVLYTKELEQLLGEQPDGQERVRVVAEIDDVWEHVFPDDLIYGAVLSNSGLYQAVSARVSAKAPFAGLLAYFKAIYGRRWDILKSVCERDGLQAYRKHFPQLVSFYTDNTLDPEGFYRNLMKVVSLLAPTDGQGVLGYNQWLAISGLYSEKQYDDLLRLLLLTGKWSAEGSYASSGDVSWANESFRNEIIGTLAMMATSENLPVFLQALFLLIEKFDGNGLISTLRDDLYTLIADKFLEGSATMNEYCGDAAADEASGENAMHNSPVHLLHKQIRVFHRFMRGLQEGLRIVEFLVHKDPVLASRLRQHRSFFSIESCLEGAAGLLDSERSANDNQFEEMRDDVGASGSFAVGRDRIGTGRRRKSSANIRSGQISGRSQLTRAVDAISTLEFVKNAYAMKKLPHLFGADKKNGTLEEKRDSEKVADLVKWYGPVLEGCNRETIEKITKAFGKHSKLTYGEMRCKTRTAKKIIDSPSGLFSDKEIENARGVVKRYQCMLEIIEKLDRYMLEKVRGEVINVVLEGMLKRTAASWKDDQG